MSVTNSATWKGMNGTATMMNLMAISSRAKGGRYCLTDEDREGCLNRSPLKRVAFNLPRILRL